MAGAAVLAHHADQFALPLGRGRRSLAGLRGAQRKHRHTKQHQHMNHDR